MLGTDRLVVGWIEPPVTVADADLVQARILEAAEGAAEQGLRLGFHNHDGELAVLDDGSSFLERLLDVEPARSFSSSIWAGCGMPASDPFALLERAGARAPLVHVKDIRKDGGPVHVPLGAGEVDYGRLLDAAGTGGGRVADHGAGRDTRAWIRGGERLDRRAGQALGDCREVVAARPAPALLSSATGSTEAARPRASGSRAG